MTSRALLVVVALAAVACGSSPEPSFYALAPTTGAIVAVPPRVVELRKPTLAGYLDRSALVEHESDVRLRVSARARWGEPLDDMIGRVLAEDLAARLPRSTVYEEDAELSADPDVVVAVDVQRFDEGEDGAIALRAQVAVRSERDAQHVARTFALRATPRDHGGTAMVGTMSTLLGQLADGIVAMLGTP